MDFGADVSFGKAAQKLQEHYGLEVPVSTIQAITKRRAAEMKQAQVVREQLEPGGVKQLIGEMDGSMVPIVSVAAREDKSDPADGRKRRKLLWREARLSLVREPEKLRGRYAATLGGPAEAGELLLDSVIRTGGGQGTKMHGVSDGAPWIAQQMKERLGEQATYLIDFYHVSEYLAEAAAVIAGPDKVAWRQTQQARLKTNQVDAVVRELFQYQKRHPASSPPVAGTIRPATDPPADRVQRCRQYLENRRNYLDYAGAIKAGLPIGSGEIESAHRSVVQARLKLPGAWWKEETAKNMLALRVLRANDDWQSYWRDVRQAAA